MTVPTASGEKDADKDLDAGQVFGVVAQLRARPYDGHGRHRPGSLLAIGAKRGEEGSLTFNGDTGEM
jgi:hypothetical protein